MASNGISAEFRRKTVVGRANLCNSPMKGMQGEPRVIADGEGGIIVLVAGV